MTRDLRHLYSGLITWYQIIGPAQRTAAVAGWCDAFDCPRVPASPIGSRRVIVCRSKPPVLCLPCFVSLRRFSECEFMYYVSFLVVEGGCHGRQ
ncbi:hypothetical protein E2C01_092094 [Portunus trituberculatus]|uniref:Uncharacterized protein n=1 Tax=Portunus trituberculatus TaxID=210409 RepID=A0A5B7JQG1_PORTR|nr:hypothetical protein [Portunus trituberculatus]